MLKWDELSNGEWTAKTEFGYLRVDDGRIDVINGPVTYLAYWDWDDPDEIAYCVTIDEAKAACEADYARRVAEIAAANGYVKLADDEMVVKRLKGGEISFGTANIDDVARHFGYVKLEPGQVVVQAELLEAVIADMRNDCDCSDGYCNNECGGTDCRVKDLTAALDASGVPK